MKYRILMISLRTDLGGGPKHLLDLMSELQKQPDLGLYFAGPVDEPFGNPLRKLAKESFNLSHRKFSFALLFKLKKFCEENRINLIHSHGRGAGLYSRLLSLMTGIPVIHTYHGLHVKKNFSGFTKITIDRILSFFTSHVIFVSDDEFKQGQAFKLFTKQFSVIENGIDIASFSNITVEPAFRKRNGEITIGSLLRNDYAKGPDLLIRNFELFNQQTSLPCILLIAGIAEGEINNRDEAIKLLGPVYPPISLLRSLDFYVSSSRYEGLPLAVLEAMAASVPCLLSKVPGHIDLIQNGAALGYDLENTKDFTAKLNQLLIDAELQLKLKTTALGLIKEKHTLRAMVEKTVATYFKILSQ